VSIDRLVCRVCLLLTIVLSVRDVPICQMQSFALQSHTTLLHRLPGMSHRLQRRVFTYRVGTLFGSAGGVCSSGMADVFKKLYTLSVAASDNECSLVTFNSDDCKIEA
jgi:hypothetical protein